MSVSYRRLFWLLRGIRRCAALPTQQLQKAPLLEIQLLPRHVCHAAIDGDIQRTRAFPNLMRVFHLYVEILHSVL